jgi:hypothetical protein
VVPYSVVRPYSKLTSTYVDVPLEVSLPLRVAPLAVFPVASSVTNQTSVLSQAAKVPIAATIIMHKEILTGETIRFNVVLFIYKPPLLSFSSHRSVLNLDHSHLIVTKVGDRNIIISSYHNVVNI